MDHKALIEQFYTAFAHADAETMVACYALGIVFEDPAFGRLEGVAAADMWRMLVKPGLRLTFDRVWAEGDKGGAHWEARYRFSQTGRTVVNRIEASFVFRDGKIVQHTDRFDFYRWSRQALGLPGWLLGWTPYLKQKVRQQALRKLQQFQASQS
ncbi:nuclear transport factor 2 family protein [Taibaiella koreensis]|uniref:nuclear transport factor 2 family protein n=1 Tax=Taibaiella koreensis TaxID=1268548 RepID=UPI000E59BDD5|nr:nuclear transport factor 2 family protein [Taibaiella koreensis]